MKTLFVDACVNRETSRTERLAQTLLKEIGGASETVVLESLDLRPHKAEDLSRRELLARNGDFSGPDFDLGRQFAEAETVVLASPYWESSFNGMTKLYLEHVSQLGLTFRYDENGIPVGLTSVKKLYYVTTRGGDCSDEDDLGFLNVKAVAHMFGISDVRIVSAHGLDIVGNDVEMIMAEAEKSVRRIVK